MDPVRMIVCQDNRIDAILCWVTLILQKKPTSL
jgi:hypothetical protein